MSRRASLPAVLTVRPSAALPAEPAALPLRRRLPAHMAKTAATRAAATARRAARCISDVRRKLQTGPSVRHGLQGGFVHSHLQRRRNCLVPGMRWCTAHRYKQYHKQTAHFILTLDSGLERELSNRRECEAGGLQLEFVSTVGTESGRVERTSSSSRRCINTEC
jgi:hypothetical protein